MAHVVQPPYRSSVALRVPLERLADSIPALRAAGVVAIECGHAELREPPDTIPAPPTTREGDCYEEPEPATVRAAGEGYKSDRFAASCGWIADPSEPEYFPEAFGDREAGR